jgi:hypothetical protein
VAGQDGAFKEYLFYRKHTNTLYIIFSMKVNAVKKMKWGNTQRI